MGRSGTLPTQIPRISNDYMIFDGGCSITPGKPGAHSLIYPDFAEMYGDSLISTPLFLNVFDLRKSFPTLTLHVWNVAYTCHGSMWVPNTNLKTLSLVDE